MLNRIMIVVVLSALPCTANAASKSLKGLPGPLVAKVQELIEHCGMRINNTYRPGSRKPNGRLSEHHYGRAADLEGGNIRCAYDRLKRYAGGYSTDYRAVKHIHISWGGKEHGLRFAHVSKSRKKNLGTQVADASGWVPKERAP